MSRAVRESIETLQQIDHKTKFNFYLWLFVYAPILVISTMVFLGLSYEGVPRNEEPDLYNLFLWFSATPMLLFVLYLIKRTFTKKVEPISNGKKDFPNGLHLVATLFTAGAWSIGWLVMFLKRNKAIYN